MYRTHKFTDALAKHQTVEDNTVDMIWLSFYSQVRSVSNPQLTKDTRSIIRTWVQDNEQQATFESISDFISRLIEDFEEARRG